MNAEGRACARDSQGTSVTRDQAAGDSRGSRRAPVAQCRAHLEKPPAPSGSPRRRPQNGRGSPGSRGREPGSPASGSPPSPRASGREGSRRGGAPRCPPLSLPLSRLRSEPRPSRLLLASDGSLRPPSCVWTAGLSEQGGGSRLSPGPGGRACPGRSTEGQERGLVIPASKPTAPKPEESCTETPNSVSS